MWLVLLIGLIAGTCFGVLLAALLMMVSEED